MSGECRYPYGLGHQFFCRCHERMGKEFRSDTACLFDAAKTAQAVPDKEDWKPLGNGCYQHRRHIDGGDYDD